MGRMKDKIIDVQEFYINGYDVEEIPFLTDLTIDEVRKILIDFGVAEEDMKVEHD
jgi:hypothetical protein